MNALLAVAAFCALLALAMGSYPFCHGLDCPTFTVLNKTDNWELRRYDKTMWVATKGQAMSKDSINSQMFYKLFNYIDGHNVNNTKIPMTAPVLTKVIHGTGPNCQSNFVMRFMIPKSMWSNTIAPTDSDVYIDETPAMDVFVRAFGGFAKDQDYMNNLAMLVQSLPKVDIVDDYFYSAGYDGPYQFTNRRNEVWVQKA